jgi:hypothetical protein
VGNLKLEAQTARVAVSVEGTESSLHSLGLSHSKVDAQSRARPRDWAQERQ